MIYRRGFLLAVYLYVSLGNYFCFAAEFFVAPDGFDGPEVSGSIHQPFASLEQARDAVRAMKAASGLPPGGVTIWLRGGLYPIDATFELTEIDSGERDRPIVYRARGTEEPRLVGGLPIPVEAFSRVTEEDPAWGRLDMQARSLIFVADLSDLTSNYGSLLSRGRGSTNEALELFHDALPMELARYPDAVDFAGAGHNLPRSSPIPGWLRTGTVAADGLTTFSYSSDRPRRWLEAEEPWLLGFWGSYWDARNARLLSIDIERRLIDKARTNYNVKAGQPFFAYNLLEEITAPGEYYLNRTNGRLYFRPPTNLLTGEVFVSMLTTPLIHLRGVAHVQFDGLTLEFGRGDLLRIDDCEDVEFRNGFLGNCGGRGATISGRRSGLERCEIANTGAAGVVVRGGDRHELVAGENYVRNCDIHHFGRLFWTYQAGVDLGGCGNRVEHCEIGEAPHAGILLNGNRHRIEFSRFARLCQWTSDMGAVYTGRDWGYRDNVIRFNEFLPLRSPFGPDQHGVYLDDCVSGLTVYGNLFIGTSATKSALMVGGGRDNIIENNIFAHNGIGIHLDSRGLQRITNDGGSWDLLKKIKAMDYKEEPWASAYPALALIPERWESIRASHWLWPEGNIFRRNIFWEGQAFDLRTRRDLPVREVNLFAENLEAADPLFIDEADGNLNLQPESPAFALPGFEPIPADRIGIEPAN